MRARRGGDSSSSSSRAKTADGAVPRALSLRSSCVRCVSGLASPSPPRVAFFLSLDCELQVGKGTVLAFLVHVVAEIALAPRTRGYVGSVRSQAMYGPIVRSVRGMPAALPWRCAAFVSSHLASVKRVSTYLITLKWRVVLRPLFIVFVVHFSLLV